MNRVADFGRRLGSNISRGARRGVAARALPRASAVWVVLRIHASMGEGPTPRSLIAREPVLGLLEALDALESAADDPRVAGVLLRFVGSPQGSSKIQSLRRAVERVRAAGKPVAAWAEALDAPGFLLASAASAIWLPEAGNLFLVGLRAEAYFFRGLLENLHVRPEVVRAGDYKSAAERLTRDRMSPEAHEQTEALLEDAFGELVSGIAAGRGLGEAEVRDRIDRGPYSARAAAEAGLIDACLYPDEVEEQLAAIGRRAGDTRPVRLVDAIAYRGVRPAARRFVPVRAATPRIAYVLASGIITRGLDGRGIPAGAMSKLFERLRERDDVRAVLLRIDSPGGDATASDLLWRAISRVAAEKPVVASMADVAASGGYFLAAAAHRVFAEATTVTGSIGVIGGKLNLEGLYRKLGISKDSIERGARAGLLSDDRDFTPDERAAVRDEIAGMYRIFVDRVASGRGLPPESIEKVGRGRVWSGARARSHGLVDEIGGPLEALGWVRTAAGLDSGDPIRLDRYPRATPLSRLAPLIGWPRRLSGLDG